nr:hypothetical protein [Rhodococcus qingshengii]
MTGVLFVSWIIIGPICAIIACTIAGRKNRSGGGFFLLGLLFPIIGVIVAILASPGTPLPPLGMRAVVCPRCNANQNVPAQQVSYECWQCKLDVQLAKA